MQDILAATNNTEEDTYLVEESGYLEDLQYDWNYTLNIHTSNLIRYVASPFPNDRQRYERCIPPKNPTLKCNCCKLMFKTENQRTQHEQSWHTDRNSDQL